MFLYLLAAVFSPSSIFAKTLAEYKENIEHLKGDIIVILDEDWTAEKQTFEREFLTEATQLLPADEKIEWQGTTIETDNRWLAEKIEEYKKESKNAPQQFAYIPQVMLVEGQGIFAAIGRSTSLAGGNVKRLAALFIFTTVATYSALSLLYIPLGWYAYLHGVQILAFDADTVPAWYEITSQFIGQISFILMMPIWMVGLCLLYVDERVRHEGYDIELMAARRLGEIPSVPRNFVNPLQPALAQNQIQNQTNKSKLTTLGLN
jgi:hypothetical protein